MGELANTLTRRMALALIAASAASPVVAKNRRRVLFVGNSFTTEHDVPTLFQKISESLGYPVEVESILQNGAFLEEHLAAGKLPDAANYAPDIVILQEHSTAALNPSNREKSGRAFLQFNELNARKIIFEPWPRRQGHALYDQDGMPGSPREMIALSDQHYRQIANAIDAQVARIGQAWLLADGITLHRSDGYHANLAGAWFAALILVRTAGFTSSAPPYVPDGMSTLTAKRLYQIARMVAP